MESQFGKIHYEIPHFSVLNQSKSCTSTDELLNAQKVALEQIKEKKYAESYIKDSSIYHVYAYAIAFSNKYCRVKVEALK
ncbi:MAG: PD-(D/E)XK nuclease domain-containing protein [Succinatimonas sp.]|nr:PD-(D/E)XK nuclease domain-containing protein [Succinatimonas sp.]